MRGQGLDTQAVARLLPLRLILAGAYFESRQIYRKGFRLTSLRYINLQDESVTNWFHPRAAFIENSEFGFSIRQFRINQF